MPRTYIDVCAQGLAEMNGNSSILISFVGPKGGTRALEAIDRQAALRLRQSLDDVLAVPPSPSDAALSFIAALARMETESEYDDRTGDGVSGDDAISTLSSLIHDARALLGED